MRRLQLAGHRPLGLVGGSTGLIGDPRPTAERTLKTPEVVAEWVQRIRVHVERFLSADGDNALRVVNNLDWTAPLSAIEFLRDIGKNFRVGTMLKKDAVSARLNSDAGISYTEFSYQILQGLDFRELYRQYECVLQTGGSDQWGNLTSGTELIRRTEGVAVHAIGTPLITNSDGTKFGKSEGNAIWLDADLTSPVRVVPVLAQHRRRRRRRPAQGVHVPQPRRDRACSRQAVADAPFKREAQRASRLGGRRDSSTVTPRPRPRSMRPAALFGQGDLVDSRRGRPSRSAIAELPSADVRRAGHRGAGSRRHRSRRVARRGPPGDRRGRGLP